MTAGQEPPPRDTNDPIAKVDGPRMIAIRRRSSADATVEQRGTTVMPRSFPPSGTLVVGMKSPTRPHRRRLPSAAQGGLRRWWPAHGPHVGSRPVGYRRGAWWKLWEDAWQARSGLRGAPTVEASVALGAAALATRIRQTYGRARGTCVLFTSSELGAWAAQVVEESARCLAADGMGNVLAVDAQLEVGDLSERFCLRAARGLSDALLGWSRLSEVIHPTGNPGLHLLPWGSAGPAGRQVLARMQGATELGPWLARLRQRFDVLLFAAPQSEAAETLALARCADLSLLVVPLGMAGRRASRRAVQSLRAQGCAVAGVTLDCATSV